MNWGHTGRLSEQRIAFKPFLNPMFADAIPSWREYNRRVEPAFDPELVKKRMKELRLNQTQMAERVGLVSQSAFSNILTGKRRVTAAEAQKIYVELRIAEPPLGASIVTVPIIGLTSAGSWREAVTMPVGRMAVAPEVAGKKAFAVEVRGDSMDKLIEDGGYIVVDPDKKELIPGKCYLIQNADHEVTVKLYARDPARFEPMSTNPEHETIFASDVDAILGRIVWKGAPV